MILEAVEVALSIAEHALELAARLGASTADLDEIMGRARRAAARIPAEAAGIRESVEAAARDAAGEGE